MLTKSNRDYTDNEETNKHEIEVEKPRTNHEIRIPQVKLIDASGTFVGIIRTDEALKRAYAAGLDLVEIVPTEKPPICKIMDLGKYIFDLKKKKKSNTHKAPPTHEIRLTPSTEIHDIQIKAKKALEFLTTGSKVILNFKAKGREAKKTDLMKAVAMQFFNEVSAHATMETVDNTYILHPKSA
jgi:translation initiation factor IF-3